MEMLDFLNSSPESPASQTVYLDESQGGTGKCVHTKKVQPALDNKQDAKASIAIKTNDAPMFERPKQALPAKRKPKRSQYVSIPFPLCEREERRQMQAAIRASLAASAR
mmetsp:Transcript_38391/g.101877  ORF Transcript_38391/g.101877 Transcript_38391/m.101877 type:complete len:109 (-) Transcript_38391:533-859(-)